MYASVGTVCSGSTAAISPEERRDLRQGVGKGIARLLHMELFPVKGATGDVDTDLDAKTEAALRAAKRCPFVLLHINGADEAAHRHDSAEKETFLRRVDDRVLSRLLASEHEIVVASDHGADPESGAHLGGPQPFFTSR